MNITSFNIKLGILVATAGVFADAQAGPPEKRPLMAKREGRRAAAAAPGDASAAQQLFYYSDGRKIYLNETGLAVAKPKPNAAMDAGKARPVRSAPQDEQLASLINAAEVGGLQVVSMENPEALRMALHDAPQEIEFVLPIVEPEQKRTSAEPAPKRTYLMMTPYIAARFAAQADAQKLIADAGLKVAKKQEHVPGGYILELSGGPIEYDRLIQAANSLYEKGKQSGEVVYAHPDFIPARTRQQVSDPGFAAQWHLSNTGVGGDRDGPLSTRPARPAFHALVAGEAARLSHSATDHRLDQHRNPSADAQGSQG